MTERDIDQQIVERIQREFAYSFIDAENGFYEQIREFVSQFYIEREDQQVAKREVIEQFAQELKAQLTKTVGLNRRIVPMKLIDDLLRSYRNPSESR